MQICLSCTPAYSYFWPSKMTSEKHRNSILMTRHYRDMGNFSDWSCRVGNLIQPIRSTTQIWVVTRHQYGISVLVSHTSFGGETSGSVFTGYLIFRTLEVLSESQIWFVYKGFYKWHLLNSMTDDLMFRSKTKGLRTLYRTTRKNLLRTTSRCSKTITGEVV